MSKSIYTPLRFYIQLTQIIGRTFTDLQQLLKSQLKPTQQAGNHQIMLHNINNNSVEAHRSESEQKKIGILQLKSQSRQQKLHQQRGKLQMVHQSCEEKKPKQQPKIKQKKLIRKYKQTNLRRKKLQSNKYSQKKREKKKMKSKKQAILEGKPYPPLNAFMLFLKQNKYQIMKKRPDLSPSEVSIHASTIWNNFNDEEKQHYVKIYRKNHEIYLQQLKIFNMKKKRSKKEREERSTQKEKDVRNSEQKEREQSNNEKNDSPFQMNNDKQKEIVNNRLRQNLRSRKRKQAHHVICLESSVSQQKSKCSQQI